MADKIGILALQGDVSEHIRAFRDAWREADPERPGEVVPIRDAARITDLDGLVLPGVESTMICRLIDKNGMRRAIQDFGGDIFATCAGLVLAASEIADDTRFELLGLLDITVRRNAFGR